MEYSNEVITLTEKVINMEKQIDIIKNVLTLSETVMEGLLHIQSALNERQLEETMFLFEDIIQAFATIEGAINNLDSTYKSEEIIDKTTKVQQGLEVAVQQYEVKHRGKLQEVLQFNLLPSVKKWRQELENGFQKYVIN
ncbi:hypothetical protein SAMN04487944_1319 [Gracilibacillus ureilyticus]|uniref:DUF8042 domain-containing protein n=1 Tax=Gracilibacillus ureilyticus TaxID=531814 RepID=A0A1H9VZR7_9BACI|nr:hypothetical protein [Gracilibacillus ureilyticus]SES27210.1 hypothetical protein SAMN04487944_1319 [Gracilibacillus ureilyticus]